MLPVLIVGAVLGQMKLTKRQVAKAAELRRTAGSAPTPLL